MLTKDEKQEILKTVGKTLQLAGVFLVGGETKLNAGVSVGDHINGLRQAFKELTLVATDNRDKGDEDDAEGFEFRYRVRYKFGVRYVNNALDEDDENFVLIEIAAEFEAHYFSDEELTDDALKVFAGLNVPYNIWPYWREYVQSTCARMGLPPLTVPFQTDIQDVDV